MNGNGLLINRKKINSININECFQMNVHVKPDDKSQVVVKPVKSNRYS
jgi:hypothetical protein